MSRELDKPKQDDIPQADPPRPIDEERVMLGCTYPDDKHPDELVFTLYHNVAAMSPMGGGMADVKLMCCAGCCRVWPEFKAVHQDEGRE